MTGDELKAKRKLMGMTQAEFAALLGVSQEMVSMMEKGTKQVPGDVVSKLDKAPGSSTKKGMF